jgi:hypothetical protein
MGAGKAVYPASKPNYSTLWALADALNITIDELEVKKEDLPGNWVPELR